MTNSASARPAFNRADFAMRPVRPSDRADIEAIAAQVWDGNDYLPKVFDAWLADSDGLFCAGILADRVVAVARLARLDADQWWMEGLRVDPAYRGLGIGRIMHHYIVKYCRRHAPGTLRFSTASVNEAVQKLADETGFDRLAAFAAYGAEADPAADTGGLRQLSAADHDRALACLNTLPLMAAAHCTLEDNWRILSLTEARLAARLAAGHVFGWLPEGDSLRGVVLLNAPRSAKSGGEEEGRLYVGAAGVVEGGDLCGLACALRGLAAQEGFPRVSWKLPDDAAALESLAAAGYEDRWDGMRVLLFSRGLSLIDDSDVAGDSDA